MPLEKLLRLPEVTDRTGLRRAAIYDAIKRGVFPRPVRIGRRAVAWPESEVQAWIAERVADARERDVEAVRASAAG